MLSIYQYSSPHEFLKDRWREKSAKNPGFSIRAWAKQLGMENHAPLHLMIAGKRPIPKKYIPHLIETLKLSRREALYLEALIELSRANTIEQKSFYLKRLHDISPKEPIRVVELENFRSMEDPLHAFLLEMSDLAGFNRDPRWIQERLRFKASIQRIETAIERLIALGLFQEDADGNLKRTHRHLSTRNDLKDKAVQAYHRSVTELAAEAVASQDVLEREFNGYAFNIRKEDLPVAKKMIRDFAKKLMERVECPEGSEGATYQLNLQFFGVTHFQNQGEVK